MKWVFHRYAFINLTVCQVLRVQDAAFQADCAVQYHRIPKRNPVALLEVDSSQHVGRGRGVYLPITEVAEYIFRILCGERPGHFLRDGVIEFLQDLDGQATTASIPQLANDLLRDIVLLASGNIMGINNDVRIDKFLLAISAHGYRPASRGCSPAYPGRFLHLRRVNAVRVQLGSLPLY